jgi:drug/metabolite transporter (DMT)-like permease
MNTIARLAAHCAAFMFFVAALRPTSVAPFAMLSVFVAGFAFLLFAPRHGRYPRSQRAWLATLLYALLLAAIFAGSDFAMTTLGNSITSRAALPAAFGGLELYWLLVFGAASVAAGALAGAVTEHRGQARARLTSSIGRSEA